MQLLTFLDNIETCIACGGADIVRIIKFVWILLKLVLFVVPVGLIVMIMVDFMKNVMAGKEDDMKKNLNIAIKRIMYCVVLFLVPTIVNFAIRLVSETTSIQAFQCIDMADSISNRDLSRCEIDYENLDKESCYICTEKKYNKAERIYYFWGNSFDEISNSDSTCFKYSGATDEDSCLGLNEVSSADSVDDSTERCYVCELGNNSMYKWGSTKPTDVCLNANGWQIDNTKITESTCSADSSDIVLEPFY